MSIDVSSVRALPAGAADGVTLIELGADVTGERGPR